MTGIDRRFRYLTALLGLIATACTTAASPPVGGEAGDLPSAAATVGEAGSIYDLDLTLVDDRGATVRLSELAGRPVVVAMIYTQCTSVCPRITQDMKVLEREWLAAGGTNATFALFSLDPDRDTPETLREFARQHHLDDTRWRLFATSDDGVRDLAAVLNVKYRQEATGDIAHSATIAVVDALGVIRHQQAGLTDGTERLLDALARETTPGRSR